MKYFFSLEVTTFNPQMHIEFLHIRLREQFPILFVTSFTQIASIGKHQKKYTV